MATDCFDTQTICSVEYRYSLFAGSCVPRVIFFVVQLSSLVHRQKNRTIHTSRLQNQLKSLNTQQRERGDLQILPERPRKPLGHTFEQLRNLRKPEENLKKTS